ncbi:MAG: GNAT family N-acetyltransferase [Nocardioidaceae bacterium]|nr:GNAT family N-acetyltransferase [Nocardioidaceae bacterium]
MSLLVEPVTGHEEGVLTAWHAALVEGVLHDSPYADEQPLEAFRVWLTRERVESQPQAWAARLDGTVVGAASALWPRQDNAHLGEFELAVVPAARRAGVGTELLEAVVAEGRRRGRRTLTTEAAAPLAGRLTALPGGAFLDRHGFAVAMTELHYVLRLPVDAALLDLLTAEVSGPSGAYRLVSWTGRCPDEWVESLCRLHETFMDQAPTGDLDVEAERWTVQRLREGEQRMLDQGRTTFDTVAVCPDGQVVGETGLMVQRGMARDGGFQSGTLVRPEHRGHRLGLAMKVRNLQRLLAHDDRERLLHTWNEQGNAPMIAVNTRLGFEPVERTGVWQRPLT